MKTVASSGTFFRCAAGLVLACVAVCIHPATAEAQTKTWLGASSGNWSVGGNWSGGSVPSGTATALRWSGSSTGNLSSTNDISGLTVSGLTFTAAPGPVTLGGNSLAITATTTSVSITTGTAAVAINMPLSMLFNTLSLNTSGGGPLTINGNIGQSGTVAGISLAAGSGWGAVTLNGTNTFSGAVNVNSGTLTIGNLDAIGAAQALGSGTTIRFGYRAATDLGFIRYTGPATTTNKRVQLGDAGDYVGGGGGFLNDGTGAVVWTGSMVTQSTSTRNTKALTLGGSNADDNEWRAPIVNVSGSAPVALTKAGAGKWILSGTNTHSGTTTVAGGVLGIANNLALQNSPLDTSGAGTIAITVTNPTVGGLVGSTNLSSVITSGYGSVTNLTLNPGAGATFTYGGTVSDGAAGMTLTKTGAGTHVLTGANSYTGGSLVGAGILQIGDGGTAGSIVGNVTLTSATSALVFNRSDATSFAGVIAGSGTVAKQGAGTLTLSGSSTFSRAADINEGFVVVNWMSATGQPSPLGAAATVNLGSGTFTGGLRHTGTGLSFDRTLNLAGTSGGGTIEADGTGAMVIAAVTASATGSKTLTLGGTSTAANAVGSIPNPNTSGALSVVKDGPGRWRLTGSASDFSGGVTVRNGTIVAAASDGTSINVPGVFGTVIGPVVGDTSTAATGTAALLAEANVTIRREITVSAQGAGSTQKVLIGGVNASGTASYSGDATLKLDRDVALVAASGGVVNFANDWNGAASGTATPSVNVAIGADGYAGTVRLSKAGTLATTGSVAVRYGTAVLAGINTTIDGVGTLSIDSGATLGGVGTVAAPLGGAGLVAPGNSPGVLTAEALDPTGGLDLAFEFTDTAPAYSSGTASVNDVLRLTAASPFLGQALDADNVVSLYLPASAASGGTFTGGFFTDATAGSFAGFLNAVTSGSFVGYYENSGGVFSYGGLNYSLLADLGKSVQVGTTPVPGTTNFQTGGPAVDGQVTTFTVVVPEPDTMFLAGIGVALAVCAVRRRAESRDPRSAPRPHAAGNGMLTKLLLSLAFAVAWCASATAATFTWIGSGTTADWSVGANWGGGVAPTSTGTHTLVWDATSTGNKASFNNIAGLTLSQINYTNAPSGVALSGSGVTLTNGTPLSSSLSVSTITINLDMALPGSSRLTDNGDTVLGGVLSGAATALTVNRGFYALYGSNTFSSGTVVLCAGNGAGSYVINTLKNSGQAQSLGTGSLVQFGAVNSNDNGRLYYTGGLTSTDKRFQIGGIDLAATGGVYANGTGPLTWRGARPRRRLQAPRR